MLPEPSPAPTEPPAADRPMSRLRAALEILLCSGYPTQLIIAGTLAAAGMRPGSPDRLSPSFVFVLSGLDTLLLLSLLFLFLKASRESPRAIFMGERRVATELALGFALVPVVFMLVIAAQLLLQRFLPWLHNVEVTPFAEMLSSPWLVAGFVVLVLLAGGVREELQRAFLLHRFEQRLGGARLGLVVTSAAFGLGHTVQGWDAAIITGLLGAFWGAVYLARRSVIGTVANHALFNVAQIALGYATLVDA